MRRISALFHTIKGPPVKSSLLVRQAQIALLMTDLEISMRSARRHMSRYAEVGKTIHLLIVIVELNDNIRPA